MTTTGAASRHGPTALGAGSGSGDVAGSGSGSATDRHGARRFGRLPWWVAPAVLAVIVVAALAVGARSGSVGGPAQRIASLESIVRCPSCEDLSVAQSNASSALAVRRQITAMVGAGDSDSQIEDALVNRYGPTILLEPPARGLDLVVWVVPVVAGAGSLAALGTLFVRRSLALRRLRSAR